MSKKTPEQIKERRTHAVKRGNPEALAQRLDPMTSLHAAMEQARRTTALQDVDPDPDPYGYAQELEQNLGLDLNPPEWKAAPDSSLWVQRMTARARRVAVTRYFLAGHPIYEIARKVKVSDLTVYKDLHTVEEEWRQAYLQDIEVLAARDLARLDAILTRLWPKVERGELEAITAALQVINQRGNILGYRQGVQVDIEQHIREVAQSQGYDPDRAVEIAQRIRIHI